MPEEIVTGFKTLPAVSPRIASGASTTVASTDAGNSSRTASPSTKEYHKNYPQRERFHLLRSSLR